MDQHTPLDFTDLVAREIAPPRPAPYPVSEAMIQHWCDALDDDIATHHDDQGLRAPATMLHIFTMPRTALLRPMPAAAAFHRLEAAGFSATMATNVEQDYRLPLRVGDRVTEQVRLESVSDAKDTPMGRGHFVTLGFVFSNQRGEVVGRQRMRVFKYRPAGQPAAMAMDAPVQPWAPALYPAPVVVEPRASGRPVVAGDALPPLVLEITPSRVVLGALASNDPMPVHHDKDTAQASGVPNIFMNIFTQTGWVGRYVQGWAGPQARLQRIALRLGVPNIAHDSMALSGAVSAVEDDTATLDLRSRNRLGEPLRASVQVVLAP